MGTMGRHETQSRDYIRTVPSYDLMAAIHAYPPPHDVKEAPDIDLSIPPGLGQQQPLSFSLQPAATLRPRLGDLMSRSYQGRLNPGSYGHPELCKRPCVYQLKSGVCHVGAKCGFCHCRHEKSEVKPDQRERQLMLRMTDSELAALFVPVFRKRATDQGLLPVAREFLELAEQEAAAIESRQAEEPSQIRQRQLRTLKKSLSNMRLSSMAQHFLRTLPENVEIAYEQMRMQLTVLEPGSESTETVIVVHL